jgi:hypothetical protein
MHARQRKRRKEKNRKGKEKRKKEILYTATRNHWREERETRNKAKAARNECIFL